MSIKKEPNKWTPSFLKHSGSIKQDTLASAQVHAHTLTHPRTHLLSSRAWTIAHRREGCEERCGILLGLIYQRLGEVLSGHSSAADAGPGLGPLGDRQTPPRSWCSGKKVHRTQTLKHTFTRTPLSLSHSCLSLPHQGKAGACQGYATPGCQLQLLSFARVCFFSFFVVFFFFLTFSFWHLSPCSVCMSMLCPPPTPTPSMTRASHSARWTSRLANLPYTPFMRSWSCHCFEKTNGISATWQLCTNTFWSFG